MARFSGANLSVVFNSVTLDGDQKVLRVNESIDTIDVSAGADTAHTYITSLTDGTATITLLRDDTSATRLVDIGDEGDLVWGPEGNTTGDPRYTVNAILTSYEESYPFDGEVEVTIGLQYSGGVVEDTYP